MKHRIDPSELLDCAISATRAAGSHALANIERRTEVVSTFKHDVKLKLDIECQGVAEKVIRSTYPSHDILGEEDAEPAGGKTGNGEAPPDNYEWIIDPIDGTVNFSHGLPMWCCSIAVRKSGATVAGAVYAPALDELYAACEGSASVLNGSPINVSSIARLSDSIVCTGLDKHEDPRIPPLSIFKKIAANSQKSRILGSAALDMCRVARGHAEGYFETGIYIWDVAAAGFIVQQAGGKSELLASLDNNRIMFMATNGLIHEKLKALVLQKS